MASFIDLFTATDSDGARAARYRVVYEGSAWSQQDSWVFGMFTALFYTVFKVVAVAANGLLGLVLASGSWLDPLSDAYRKFTEPFYRIVPPWVIACAGLAIVVISAWRSAPKSTTSGVFNSESLNRIGTALALMIMVIVLTHNPFALLTQVLEVANGFSIGLSSAVTSSTNDSTITAGQALVDNSIRTPTIALTYGTEFSDACKTAWSQAMASGKELTEASGCFNKGQNHAGPDTVITAVLMLFLPALPMLVFSVIAAWKYLLHLTMSVLCTVMAAWVAAASIHKRRGFEQLAEMFARAASHLAMAVVTSMVAVALPTTVAGLATQLLGLVSDAETQAFVMMLSLGVGFLVSTWAIYRITSNHGLLVRYLKANANITMESTLGMTPVKFSNITNKYKKFHAVKAEYDKDQADAQKKEAAAATKTATAAAAATTLKQKGAAAVPVASEEDAAAVEQLTQPAESVATAASDQLRTDPVLVAVPDPDATANRTWSQMATGHPAQATPSGSGAADPFGYFTVKVTPTMNPDGAAFEDSEPADAEATGEPSTETAAQPAASADGEASTAAAAVATGEPVGATQTQNGLTEFTDPTRVAPTPVPDTPIVPVAGNTMVDPALNEAARAAGATLDLPAVRPTPPRVLSEGRHFHSDVATEAVPFSVPSIAHGAALSISADDEAAAQSDTGAGEGTDADEAVNDQQRWNQRGRAFFPRSEDEDQEAADAASSALEPEMPPSGIGPGANPNPAAFHGPLPDFLATEQAEAELELATVTLAASGKQPRVALSSEDSRISLRLTSDPNRRVEKGGGRGFGDPT